jgi:cytochrome c oxidase accessory protein FixG
MAKKDASYFRDKLTTVDEQGKRVWLYPKKPKGKLFNKRRALAIVLLALLYVGPFIKVHGQPLLMFNILERKFILFGTVFWPQDFHLIVLMLITLILFVVLFTVIFGRLFCGWVCPQTIFMEFVFRRIEYLIEGDSAAQRRLAKQEWNFEKIWKKSLKHIIFYTIAFVTANTFLAYIIGADQLMLYIKEGPAAHLSGFTGLLIFSGVFYFIFAFFREQVCTIACPYGRLQSVLIDPKTLIVAYDYKRGEPRGPLSKAKKENLGDCVNCNACVAVCPTGIDIRNGTQLECINCTACIDACNATMGKVNRPKGLIRYDSEEGIETGKHHLFNTRSIAYSVVLTALLGFVVFLFAMRGDYEATILRARGSMYQEYGKDSLSNIYNYNIVNKSRKPIKVSMKLLSPSGTIHFIGGKLTVPVGEVGKGTFMVVLPKNELKSSNVHLVIGLYDDGKIVENYHSTFVAPNNLDQQKK